MTTAELGNWIVQNGGILVCARCASDAHKAAESQASSRAERVEKPPVRNAPHRR